MPATPRYPTAPLPRLGLLPCRAAPEAPPLPAGLALGLPALLERVLWPQPGIDVISAAALAPLGSRLGAREQAARARRSYGLSHVLHLRLHRHASGTRLAFDLEGPGSLRIQGLLRGDEPLALVGELTQALAGPLDLSPAHLANLPGDPFILQAWARGEELFAAGQWEAAMFAYQLVQQACPDDTALHLARLRCAVAARRPEALASAEALAKVASAQGDVRLEATAHAMRQLASLHLPSAEERLAGVTHGAAALRCMAHRAFEPWAVALKGQAGACAAASGDSTTARSWLTAASRNAAVAGLPLLQSEAEHTLAAMDLAERSASAAESRLKALLPVRRNASASGFLVRSLGLLALAQWLQGRADEAMASANETRSLLRDLPAVERPSETLATLALLMLGLADTEVLRELTASFPSEHGEHASVTAHRMAVRACLQFAEGQRESARALMGFAVACMAATPNDGLGPLWRDCLQLDEAGFSVGLRPPGLGEQPRQRRH